MFKNYSAEEAKANARTLLPKGNYPFTVKKAFDQDESGQPLRSSKGNAMIKLMLHVHRDGGGVQYVDCYITDQPSMAFLARHLAETTGTLAAYDDGMWDARVLIGTSGTVLIDVEGEKPMNGGGTWPAKNIVKDFIPPEKTVGSAATFTPSRKPQPTDDQLANNRPGDPDDVPFAPIRYVLN